MGTLAAHAKVRSSVMQAHGLTHEQVEVAALAGQIAAAYERNSYRDREAVHEPWSELAGAGFAGKGSTKTVCWPR